MDDTSRTALRGLADEYDRAAKEFSGFVIQPYRADGYVEAAKDADGLLVAIRHSESKTWLKGNIPKRAARRLATLWARTAPHLSNAEIDDREHGAGALSWLMSCDHWRQERDTINPGDIQTECNPFEAIAIELRLLTNDVAAPETAPPPMARELIAKNEIVDQVSSGDSCNVENAKPSSTNVEGQANEKALGIANVDTSWISPKRYQFTNRSMAPDFIYETTIRIPRITQKSLPVAKRMLTVLRQINVATERFDDEEYSLAPAASLVNSLCELADRIGICPSPLTLVRDEQSKLESVIACYPDGTRIGGAIVSKAPFAVLQGYTKDIASCLGCWIVELQAMCDECNVVGKPATRKRTRPQKIKDNGPERPTPSRDEPLSELEQLVLMVLGNEEAFDSDSRIPTEEIAALGNVSADTLKRPVASLKRKKFLKTRAYRGGGIWLITKGKARSERLRQTSNQKTGTK